MVRFSAVAAGLMSLAVTNVRADPPQPASSPFTKQQAKAVQEAWAKYLGKKVEEEIDIGGGLTMVFELIPPGTFMMGSTEEETRLTDDFRSFGDELPRHKVTITRPFYFGRNTVTQAEYVQLTGKANPSYYCSSGDGKDKVTGIDTGQFPVEQVNSDDAMGCASALEKKLGARWIKVRLPSEAMWEYSCRAGTETRWHVGKRLTKENANFDYKLDRPRRVGEGMPNAFGLYDMHGNIQQWCSDGYAKYPTSAQVDPEVPVGTKGQVHRGCCFVHTAGLCRSACRGFLNPEARNSGIGFRLVLVPRDAGD